MIFQPKYDIYILILVLVLIILNEFEKKKKNFLFNKILLRNFRISKTYILYYLSQFVLGLK
jgi:hypothetical protein